MPTGDITQLLHEWSEGDTAACEPLFEYAYPQLRRNRRRALPGRKLQPPPPAHRHRETSSSSSSFSSTASALRIASTSTRSPLRSCAASSSTTPAPSTAASVTAAFCSRSKITWHGSTPPPPDILDLDRVLNELSVIDPRKTRIVELRFYLGLSAQETAEVAGVSKATVDRELLFVRGWDSRPSPGSPLASFMRRFTPTFRVPSGKIP